MSKEVRLQFLLSFRCAGHNASEVVMMFSIREMSRHDVDRVVEIISAHHKIDGDMAAEYYRQYFSDKDRVASPRERNVVATVDPGEVVGVAGFCPDEYGSLSVLWLTWFYVDPKYQGRGIGTKLLKYVIDAVRKLGIRKLYVDTSSDESYAAAVTMYKRFGFREEGRLLHYYDDGEHCLILGLELDAQVMNDDFQGGCQSPLARQ
jgi:ribosomal protein S18 acetylase RimI-like enzyme